MELHCKNKEEWKWQRVDCMVVSWLLSSISKDIVEAFLYTTSAHELWKELETRFGDSNGPMLYDVQKRITSLAQGEMSISTYFTKLKKMWDELAHINPLPKCTCGSSKSDGRNELCKPTDTILDGVGGEL
ncbi:UNVERIFIED_CONTAM: hypothetical protein Slati_3552100 [Sesamum latifolium]|uniref:Retrotransposon gag domain-containing protein n=1 Tax=Sesamum latifolium TaxID=2727402 RepID=A0AAW2UKH9_9LAMI